LPDRSTPKQNVLEVFLTVQLRGAQPFRQAGHIERYNVLQGLEHSDVSTKTNTELNITIKIA
jgi:hypothetical protein